MDEYIEEILAGMPEEGTETLTFRKTKWVIGNFLRGWQMDVPEGWS